MDNMTIGEVSAQFQISARMLRYYEKAGLIASARKEGYAYRIYDADAVRKIQQIIILRKLQIPLKQIRRMMDGNKEEAVQILETRLQTVDNSTAALRAIRKGLEILLKLLREDDSDKNYMEFVQKNTIVELTGFLPLEKHHLQNSKNLQEEHKMSVMSVENMADMANMVDKSSCVRIVLLPPCTVAACQFAGDNPEETVGDMMDHFIRSSGLYAQKPDARLFGFNNPEMKPGGDFHGYEDWITIPDDLEPPAPLTKKHFPGGLYAAYTINFPDFHEWDFLAKWVENSETWQADYHRDGQDLSGCLEEHLNWVYSSHMGWPENGIDGKVDLLLPIKAR